MKTDTKDKLLALIKKEGVCRPHDLSLRFKLSPQIIHRHLKDLVKKNLIEARGKAPFTEYSLADVPDFNEAKAWLDKGRPPSKKASDFICETRDVFHARLHRFSEYGIKKDELPLAIAVAGEVGNNCFDHNLGKWRDQPGCWFEIQETSSKLWVLIGDRGQGIRSSLQQIRPNLSDDHEALRIAFEERVSGRAPEKRGNGLKFVRESILSVSSAGVACFSGKAILHYGNLGEPTKKILEALFKKILGTLTLMSWNLK